MTSELDCAGSDFDPLQISRMPEHGGKQRLAALPDKSIKAKFHSRERMQPLIHIVTNCNRNSLRRFLGVLEFSSAVVF
jgi:hypothetical protein